MMKYFFKSLYLISLLSSAAPSIASPASRPSSDYVKGQVYLTKRPLLIIDVRYDLVLSPQLSARNREDRHSFQTLDEGTHLKVSKIKFVNTITHGYEAHPYAKITEGRFKGVEVYIGQIVLKPHLKKMSP